MIDKINFMETLRSVAELTRTSNEPLSKEEVMSYFTDMELTKEQQDMVYQYILQPHDEEVVPEEQDVEESTNQKESDPADEEEVPAFFKMYQEDVNELSVISDDEEKALYRRLLDGDASTIEALTDKWLSRVLTIAKEYSIHKVNMEDLVQEGNIGLLSGLSNLLGNPQIPQVEEYIRESVKKSMEDFIDEMMEEQDWESTVVAKATLIHEANKALAEELGRIPTKEELSEYTKLSLDEIQDILDLSETEKSKK